MPRRSLRDVVHAAVECATVRPVGNWFDTAVRCRNQPNRVPCRGYVTVKWEPGEITWLCPDCGDSGSVHDWEGGDSDLREFAADPFDDPEHELLLSPSEFAVLWGLDELRYACPRLLAACTYRDGRVEMTGSRRELMYLLATIENLETPLRGEKLRAVDDVVRYVAATLEDI